MCKTQTINNQLNRITMKTFMNFIARLASSILILIFIECCFTLGAAFEFERYNWLGYLIQICLLTICIRVSLEDWEVFDNPTQKEI